MIEPAIKSKFLGALVGTGVGDALGAPFWIGVVLLAILIPLWLDVANWGKQIGAKRVTMVITLSLLCVIISGLILRVVLVIGDQI